MLVIFIFGYIDISLASDSKEIIPKSQQCIDISLSVNSIKQKRDIERFAKELVQKNKSVIGEINWKCIIKKFNSLDSRTNAEFIESAGTDNSDVIRFTVDRSSNIIISLLTFAPGGSNGVFTATFRHTRDGRIALITRGGEPKWLEF